MRAKTLEELEKQYADKLAALKQERAEILKKAREREGKRVRTERKRERKRDNHIKFIIGGFYLKKITDANDKKAIADICSTIDNANDKALLEAILVERVEKKEPREKKSAKTETEVKTNDLI